MNPIRNIKISEYVLYPNTKIANSNPNMHSNAYHYTGSSINSRFMQLEMSVSSTSLKRFSPSKSLFMRGTLLLVSNPKSIVIFHTVVTLCNGSFRTGRYNKTHFDEDGGFEGFNVTIYSDYFHV